MAFIQMGQAPVSRPSALQEQMMLAQRLNASPTGQAFYGVADAITGGLDAYAGMQQQQAMQEFLDRHAGVAAAASGRRAGRHRGLQSGTAWLRPKGGPRPARGDRGRRQPVKVERDPASRRGLESLGDELAVLDLGIDQAPGARAVDPRQRVPADDAGSSIRFEPGEQLAKLYHAGDGHPLDREQEPAVVGLDVQLATLAPGDRLGEPRTVDRAEHGHGIGRAHSPSSQAWRTTSVRRSRSSFVTSTVFCQPRSVLVLGIATQARCPSCRMILQPLSVIPPSRRSTKALTVPEPSSLRIATTSIAAHGRALVCARPGASACDDLEVVRIARRGSGDQGWPAGDKRRQCPPRVRSSRQPCCRASHSRSRCRRVMAAACSRAGRAVHVAGSRWGCRCARSRRRSGASGGLPLRFCR